MANNNNSAFQDMKYEIAKEVGVNLKQGYNGDISARDAGKIGGNIVRKVFQQINPSGEANSPTGAKQNLNQ